MKQLSFIKKASLFTCLLMLMLQSKAVIVYQYGFENLCGNLCTTASPWLGVPDVLATGLTNAGWTTSYSGGFISYAGSCGTTACQALSISHNDYPASTTYTLTLNVTAGYSLSITGISYWDRESGTAPTNVSITVNSVSAFNNIALQGATGANTGLMPTTFNNLTGTVTLVMTMTGASSANGTFRLDDFVIEGSVTTGSVVPTLFNVTGTGGYCAGTAGATVGLSGSQAGVNYQLISGGSNIGNPVAGTGNAISFGLHTAGTYTVFATGVSPSDTATMTGSAVIVINPLPVNNLGASIVQCGGSDTLNAGNPGSHYLWSNGDTTQMIVVVDTGFYSVTVTAVNGCTVTGTDTIEILPVPPAAVITASASPVCAGATVTLSAPQAVKYHWNTNDSTSSIQVNMQSSTTYSVTVITVPYPGCKATGSTTITVVQPVASTISAQVCPGGNYYGHTAAGTFIDTFTASNGCDSIRNLTLTLGQVTATTDTQVICSGQTYGGHNATGIYVDTLHSIGGCDSIRTLNLTLFATVSSIVSKTICSGQSYQGHTATGIYTDTLSTIHGCDSLALLNLTVSSVITASDVQNICTGQSYRGHTANGTYTDTVSSAGGCDSIITLTLTVYPVQSGSGTMTICSGTSYHGHSASGTFNDTLNSIHGCDSVINLTLTVSPALTGASSKSVCYGTLYQGHSASGIYMDTIPGGGRCDSIITLTLTVLPALGDSSAMSICHGHSYKGHTTTGIYSDTLSSAGGCDSISIVNLTVNALPHVTLYLPFDSVCVNAAPFACAGGSPPGGYYVGLGISAGQFNPAVAGIGKDTIDYLYTDSNNCTKGRYEFMYVDSCNNTGVGINEVSATSFKVWPNPTQSNLTIETYGLNESCQFNLYDMLGQTYVSGTLSATITQTMINLHELPSGIYLLAVSGNKGVIYSQKIVRE